MRERLNCVLLVDDDEGTNFYNSVIIERADIAKQVEIVLNGQEALDYITGTGTFESDKENLCLPELILLDINMPVMDGWDFMEEFSKLDDKVKGKIKIIMLSTSRNPDDKKRAENIPGVSGFRNKPLSVEGVLEMVKSCFH